MYKLCRVNIECSQEIIREVKDLARKIKKLLPVTEIYLFGSFARGEINEASDIDLLVIGHFEERFIERIGKILDMTDLPVEPLVYTVEEFEELKSNQNPFICEVLKTAIRL